ncbi:hypothetical protein AC579_2905 [Pseudocercospora musae]|uniref:Uncharacterized protein n=1 Tax=Pseudocercospora musae TaxID=113226 RepID=A0A139IUK4_9PEZI|nr:hypothetical protein AC579_2905 [Pseudocercospora musae]
MSRPFRSEASMCTNSTYLRNLMAEEDREHAKRLAEEKEMEAERAEQVRHLSTPGSWIDEDITPKQPFYYFPDTPYAPEKNDVAGRKALVKETVAKEAESIKRQQASTFNTPTRKPGLSMAATGMAENSMPPKESSVRVNPYGQRDDIQKASASVDQYTGKETPMPRVLGEHLDSTRIAKPNAACLGMTAREAENAIQAKLENAQAEYMEGRRRFEIASGGMPFDHMWESDAKFHLLEDRDYYGPLLKKIDAWKGLRDWYSAKLAALKAKYSKPRIQRLRNQDSPSSARIQTISVEEKPTQIKSTRERFEAFRAFESANSQPGSWATPAETDTSEPEDRPAPRYSRASDESKHDDQSILTSSNGVEDTASQHAWPLERSHAKASRYVESAQMEPVQVEEHALQETQQTKRTPPTKAERTVSQHAFSLEQPYAQAVQHVQPVSSEPPQVENTLPLYEQNTPIIASQFEDTVSQHALHLEQPHVQAAQYIKPTPPKVLPMGQEVLPRREQSDVTSPEPVIYALNNHKKLVVPAATPSQSLPHKGEGRWSNHKCNMPYCRAHFSFAKNYPDLGVFNGRPSVLGKPSATDTLGIDEQELETRRVRKKLNKLADEVVHVLAAGYLHPPTVVEGPKTREAAGIEYLPAPANPFESPISAVNSVQTRDNSEYRKAMDLYERGLHFGADGLEGKDDDAASSGGAMDIDDGEGIEEGEEVHGYVERFLSDPTSHNGVYFIYRHSGLGDMIKIDIPRDIWLRQNDHNEDNLDRAHIYVLIQLCEIVRLDNKLLSAMDPNVAGQLADSNLSMILRAFTKFANSYSWLDRWTIRRRVRRLLGELIKFSTAFDRDDDQMMQLFVDDSDGPAAHALKALRRILAETENDKNPPTSGEAPRRAFTRKDPTDAPTGPRKERSKGTDRKEDACVASTHPAGKSVLEKQGTAARESNSRTVADATKARSRDASMVDATTGVPVGAPTRPRADKGKARMQPEGDSQKATMGVAPLESFEQPRESWKSAMPPTIDQSKKRGVQKTFPTPDQTDQDMLDAGEALTLGPRNFSGAGSSKGPPPNAPKGPRRLQDSGPDRQPSKMPPRPDHPYARSGPPRLRDPNADTRPTSMPPRRNEPAGGRFGIEDRGSGRGRSQTRDEQPRRRSPRSKEREERARRQEERQSNGPFSSDRRRQHESSGQRQPERPPRPVNPNAGLGHQYQPNQPNGKAAQPRQGLRNAHNNHAQPIYGRNGPSASQTQGGVDVYAQARLQNNQSRNNQNRLRSNAMSGGRAHIKENAPESGHSFLGAARKKRPNLQN